MSPLPGHTLPLLALELALELRLDARTWAPELPAQHTFLQCEGGLLMLLLCSFVTHTHIGLPANVHGSECGAWSSAWQQGWSMQGCMASSVGRGAWDPILPAQHTHRMTQ